MLAAVHLELVDRRIAGDDRRIDERVVVVGSIMVGLVVGCGSSAVIVCLPDRGKLEMNVVRPPGLLDQGDEAGRSVEDPERLTNVVGRHRCLLANQLVADDNLGPAAGFDLPAVLLGMLDFQFCSVRPLGREIFDLRFA